MTSIAMARTVPRTAKNTVRIRAFVESLPDGLAVVVAVDEGEWMVVVIVGVEVECRSVVVELSGGMLEICLIMTIQKEGRASYIYSCRCGPVRVRAMSNEYAARLSISGGAMERSPGNLEAQSATKGIGQLGKVSAARQAGSPGAWHLQTRRRRGSTEAIGPRINDSWMGSQLAAVRKSRQEDSLAKGQTEYGAHSPSNLEEHDALGPSDEEMWKDFRGLVQEGMDSGGASQT